MRLPLTVAIFFALLLHGPLPSAAQTSGTVTVRVKTVSYGGKYADKNIGAIWVENAQNTFVKTLEVWAKKRIKHLIKWQSASSENVVDAVTGATIRQHDLHEAIWNCKDINNVIADDGNYKIFVEFTEDNSNSGGPAGKWASIEFTKGQSSQKVTPADQSFFVNMEVLYEPSNSTDTGLSGTVKDASTQNVLSAVTIQLKEAGIVRYETTSNSSGFYAFNNIAPGDYILLSSKNGYDSTSQQVSIAEGEQLTGRDIYLTPQANSEAPAPPQNVRAEVAP